MDGVTTGNSGRAGVRVEIDHDKIAHVNMLLKAFPDKALTVYERAMRRGIQAGKTQADKEMAARYAISPQRLGTKYKKYFDGVRRDGAGVAGHIHFSGAKIPIYMFNIKPSSREYTTRYVNGIGGWRITTTINAEENKGKPLVRKGMFIAGMTNGHGEKEGYDYGGLAHTGVFSRYGANGKLFGWTNTDERNRRTKRSKQRVREIFSYSVRDMLDYDPAREAIRERMREIVEKRIDHELLRELDQMK